MRRERREEHERLYLRMVWLRRLIGDRLSAIVDREDVYLLDDGTPVWDGEEEWAEEEAKWRRADRIVLSLHRLLGTASSVGEERLDVTMAA